MSTSNGKITAPVTILDVARTIGVASGDLGRLCTSNVIDKWSENKPMHVDNHPNPLTEEIKRQANYGLDTSIDSSKPIPTTVEIQKKNLPVIFNSELSDSELKEGTIWRYEVPTVHTRNGRPAGTKFKDAGGFLSYYRLSDFAGYNHRASPLVKVKDNFKLVDNWYNLTLEISTDDGGLTFENFNPFASEDSTQEWNMIGWYLNVFVVSDNKLNSDQAAYYGVGTQNGMFVPFVSSTDGNFNNEVVVSFPKRALDHLMGTWFVCVMISPKQINYEMGEDSFKTGAMGENDIYIAYPVLKTDDVGTKCIFVENAIMRLEYPDGAGKILWEQAYLSEGSGSFSTNYYSDNLLMSSITMDSGIDTPTGFIRFRDTSDGTYRGFDIDLQTRNVESIVKRKFRSIVFFNNTRNVGTLGFRDPNNYLTYDALNNTTHVGTYYKPLLRGVSLLNINDGDYANGTADFYLKFTGSTRYQQVIMNVGGTESVIFTTHNAPSSFIGQIEFQNIVNTRTNKPEGFRVKIRYGTTSDSSLVDERHPLNKYSPNNAEIGGTEFILSTNISENKNTGTYGSDSLLMNDGTVCPFIQEDYSIDCHLPESLASSQSGSGGGLYVLYDVTSDDYE